MRKELDGALLVSLLRERKPVHCALGFAELTGVDYYTAKRAFEHKSPDGLALICKAAGIEKALFVTLAVLRSQAAENAFNDAREIGAIYEKLEPDQAERALRFWKLRKQAAAAA